MLHQLTIDSPHEANGLSISSVIDFSKAKPDCCPNSRCALQFYRRIMHHRAALYDGQAKTRSPRLFGVTFIDAVKALSEEKIVLSFNSAISPFTVENVQDKKCQYLVLPVRTGATA